MRGAILYGPRDIRFAERPEPVIVEPTDAIAPEECRYEFSAAVRRMPSNSASRRNSFVNQPPLLAFYSKFSANTS